MGWAIGSRGFDSRRGLGIFLFFTASRPALGPTQPAIQWVLEAHSLGVKRPGHETDHSSPPSAEVKNAWNYTSAPTTYSWRGTYLSTGTNFHFPFCYQDENVATFISSLGLNLMKTNDNIGHGPTDKRQHWIILDTPCCKGSECDTEHFLVFSEVRDKMFFTTVTKYLPTERCS
jgi:hypothetical protein